MIVSIALIAVGVLLVEVGSQRALAARAREERQDGMTKQGVT